MSYALGVIGGSGIYDSAALDGVTFHEVGTPFGRPSDVIGRGVVGGTELLFLPRHGKGHTLAPHELNNRANIWALKKLGATHLISLSAVGSMREAIEPGHVVVVDQYIDWTKRRIGTFCEDGVVGHASFADPVCGLLARALSHAAADAGATVHPDGTYLCMEGPQFSSRAESRLYRSWGVSVIGMTALPEAKLAREAELPYATLALVTDYDCWHENEETVSVQGVLALLRSNAELAWKSVLRLLANLPDPTESVAHRAMQHSILTRPDAVTEAARERVYWLFDKS